MAWIAAAWAPSAKRLKKRSGRKCPVDTTGPATTMVVFTVVCVWAGADCSVFGAALSSAEARDATSAMAQAASGAVGNRLIDALHGLGPAARRQGGRLCRLVVVRP